MAGPSNTTKITAFAQFQLMAATERDLAAKCAAAPPEAGDASPEHWEYLTRLWQTALDVIELYRLDPLFAGRVDGAIWEHKKRIESEAAK